MAEAEVSTFLAKVALAQSSLGAVRVDYVVGLARNPRLETMLVL